MHMNHSFRMVSLYDLGMNFLFVSTVVVILSVLFQYMPTVGLLSELTWQLKTAAVFILGVIVIGPGRVAYDLVVDRGF